MDTWKEPIVPDPIVTDCVFDPTEPYEIPYREHSWDEVFEGYSDVAGFYPQCRLQRHFIDGELVESHRVPLKKGDPYRIPHSQPPTSTNL